MLLIPYLTSALLSSGLSLAALPPWLQLADHAMIRPCCLTGHVATGEPKGEMKTIGGVDAYVATPAADKAQDGCAVVLLTGTADQGLSSCQCLTS